MHQSYWADWAWGEPRWNWGGHCRGNVYTVLHWNCENSGTKCEILLWLITGYLELLFVVKSLI